MNELFQVISKHPAVSSALGVWVLSNIAGAMPSPDDKSGKFYKFVFGFMHGIGGSIPRIGATLFPQYAKFFGASGVDSGSGSK